MTPGMSQRISQLSRRCATIPAVALIVVAWLAAQSKAPGTARAETAPRAAAFQEGAGKLENRRLSFVTDVLPVLSKAGCNQGRCHASRTGKGGLLLSVKGFAPELDYTSLTHDLFDRRVNSASPDDSLILLKSSLTLPHQGGRVLPRDGHGYAIVREWIRQGARPPEATDPHVVRLEVAPSRQRTDIGGTVQLRVNAYLSNGVVRDVTEWALYDTNDTQVATVTTDGIAKARSPGKAAISAKFRGVVAAAEISVPFQSAAKVDYDALPRTNYIDDIVIDEWRSLRLEPSAQSDDTTFLRRVFINLTGKLPTPRDVASFVKEDSKNKRATLVDRLLESRAFVDMWTQKWSDVFRVSREWIGEKAIWSFNRFLRRHFENNTPWDVVARELISGTGNVSERGGAAYYRLQRVYNQQQLWPLVAAETTSQVFLGVQIGCARCHNHPFEKWTQDDYYSMASFFSQVGNKNTPAGLVIHDRNEGEIDHPRRGRPMPPRPLGAQEFVPEAAVPRRAQLATWITTTGRRQFARATANRIWRHFMGVGLVEPVDDFRASNPPSNEALLDALARDFEAHEFDVRHLIRRILNSQVYQLSSQVSAVNRGDRRFYSHHLPQRMTAEQLLDALGDVTGKRESFAGVPAHFRAQQLPDTKFTSTFLDSFGRPLRRLASCECERVQEPNLIQALELMNSELLNAMVSADGKLVDELLQAGMDDAEMLDAIYLRSLSRPPRPAERARILAQLKASSTLQDADSPAGSNVPAHRQRRQFFQDVLWALLNTKEFLFAF